MQHNQQSGTKASPQGITSGYALLGRLLWFLIGPAVLLVTTLLIVRQGAGGLTIPNAVYVATVGLMLWGRHIEQRSGVALTATGESVTLDTFRRYRRLLVTISAAVWLVANALGNHVLNWEK